MFKRLINYLRVDLRLFDDSGSAPVTQTPSSTPGVATPNNTPSTPSTTSRANQSNLANVVYGKVESGEQNPNAQGAEGGTEQKPQDRAAEFARLKAEYKDLYGAEVEAIIKDRFKKYNGLEQQIGQISPIVNLLMEQKGVKDPAKLYEMLQEETFEAIADREGRTVEEIKERETLKAQNNRLQTELKSITEQDQLNQRITDWRNQEKQVKEIYPNFNLDELATNEKFMDLLFANVPIQTAYEVLNLNDIKANVAKQMEKNVVTNIQAKGQKRIVENGLNPTPGMVVKSSVDQLTREDRAEIARRARMGERITF